MDNYPIYMGFGDSSLRYPIGLSQFKKLVLITMFGVAKNRKEDMTEEEFLALVNLVEFESESLDNFELNDKEKDKSIRKDLITLKELIKKQGRK